jgi:hypothetical protein
VEPTKSFDHGMIVVKRPPQLVALNDRRDQFTMARRARSTAAHRRVPKDWEELEEIRLSYQHCERGRFLRDFEMYFGGTPSMKVLKELVNLMGKLISEEVRRQVKRHRDLCLGWFDVRYDAIRPHLPMIIINEGEGNRGPLVREWTDFVEANPGIELPDFLRLPPPSLPDPE